MKKNDLLWREFSQLYHLSEQQIHQFKRYYELLKKYNDLLNLTTITELSSVLSYHFDDSLRISSFYDFNQKSTIVDVGTGAGFPGIPLKILYPHLHVILIEVVAKKRDFLEHVCQELELKNYTIEALDWRTFIRKTDYPADTICARASLAPEELVRMFRPTSPYKNADLIYWASEQWQPVPRIIPFIVQEMPYQVKRKKRKYVFFALPH